MPEHYFHLALTPDWEAASEAGTYTVSTAGKTLEEVGFIHMSRADQVAGTATRVYGGSADLLLLEIDPALLDAPVVDDPVGTTTFPHLYGPLPVSAVVSVRPYRP